MSLNIGSQVEARQVDEQRRGVLPTLPHLRDYDNLFVPKLSGERWLDRPFRVDKRLQLSKPKRQQ